MKLWRWELLSSREAEWLRQEVRRLQDKWDSVEEVVVRSEAKAAGLKAKANRLELELQRLLGAKP